MAQVFTRDGLEQRTGCGAAPAASPASGCWAARTGYVGVYNAEYAALFDGTYGIVPLSYLCPAVRNIQYFSGSLGIAVGGSRARGCAKT